MQKFIKARLMHGYQAIPDIRKSEINKAFRGFPVIKKDGISILSADMCPIGAILEDPIRIDMGSCVFCGRCQKAAGDSLTFTNFHYLASDSREKLILDGSVSPEDYRKSAVKVRAEIKKIFGRSLKLRSVSAGGCNGCENELNASGNVNFDMGRFGIEMVASPRHADGIVITGPINENMAKALEDAYRSVPEPRIVILMGTCAISGGVFKNSPALNRSFIKNHPIDLYLPGCPVHPLTFINGVLDFMGR